MSGDRPTARGAGPASGAEEPRATPRRRGRLGPVARAALGCAAVATLAFAGGFAAFVVSIERGERPPVDTGDGIVALTGGAERIEDALDLLSRGFGTRLLITGVNERTNRAEIARLSPGQRRLVECCVDLDYRARNTVGNAHEIRRWAQARGFRSLVVVTSNYHLPRTLVELDHALPAVRKIPYAVVANTRGPEGWRGAAARTRLLLSEYVKFIAVWLRTRLIAPSPDAPGTVTASRLPEPAAERGEIELRPLLAIARRRANMV